MRTLLLLAACSLLGCGSYAYALREQAAFDDKCPIEKVKVIDWGPNQQSADVNVCGVPKSYFAQFGGASEGNPGQISWVQRAK